jgi:predicted nuclease of restriction endonuclease-like (RecB) superfamily
MRAFYVAYREIMQTLSAQSVKRSVPKKVQTASAQFGAEAGSLVSRFPLPWSHYVRLLALRNERARSFYETEALRGGWSIRQLARQIDSQFYERTVLSRDKKKMLTKGMRARPDDHLTPEEQIKEPYVLEFLGLKDEYSETDLEEALIRHLEAFLLELGGDFMFVGRQRRLRVGDAWYRVDLLFFHRRLRCLIVIDLKLGELTHVDAGQMHLYLNYAREHWTMSDENPPVGLILCAKKDHAVAKYALEGLPNKVLAAEYRTALPAERALGRGDREDAAADRGPAQGAWPWPMNVMRRNGPHSRISKERLAEMIEQATVDAYGESEQTTAWFTMIDDNLAVPFETTVLGVPVKVERVVLSESEVIVAICERGRDRQVVSILDLPLPTPQPEGAEWIEAYRRWLRRE